MNIISFRVLLPVLPVARIFMSLWKAGEIGTKYSGGSRTPFPVYISFCFFSPPPPPSTPSFYFFSSWWQYPGSWLSVHRRVHSKGNPEPQQQPFRMASKTKIRTSFFVFFSSPSEMTTKGRRLWILLFLGVFLRLGVLFFFILCFFEGVFSTQFPLRRGGTATTGKAVNGRAPPPTDGNPLDENKSF